MPALRSSSIHTPCGPPKTNLFTGPNFGVHYRIPNARHGNQGGIGNTLEDLLEIKENNLPIPNASEWELKTQRMNTTSLTTLLHSEPSPRAIRFVPQVLLPKYGWMSQEAGKKYASTERSFRQTIHGASPSDRGFMVKNSTAGEENPDFF